MVWCLVRAWSRSRSVSAGSPRRPRKSDNLKWRNRHSMPSMLTLYLVRHGQTDASRNDILCGALDLPLNPSGLATAEALANRYQGETWQAIYASPKLRAIQTATPLAER